MLKVEEKEKERRRSTRKRKTLKEDEEEKDCPIENNDNMNDIGENQGTVVTTMDKNVDEYSPSRDAVP